MFAIAAIVVPTVVLLSYYAAESQDEDAGRAYVPQDAPFAETSDEPAAGSEILTGPNNQFAVKYYKHAAGSSDENIFFSPLSVFTAFSMVYEGAGADTAAEIQRMFDFPEDADERQRAFSSMLDSLNPGDSEYDLSLANALWLDEGFEPFAEYAETVTGPYGSRVSTVEFDGNEGVDEINAWTDEKTNGRIKEILAPGSTDDRTRLVITNALYFKGLWKMQFDKLETDLRDFFKSSDEKIEVFMMYAYDAAFQYYENDDLEILSMPYEGDELSMLILLPKDVDGLESLENEITGRSLHEWNEQLSSLTFTTVAVPKFKFSASYDLKRDLMGMGMTAPFESGKSDLSKITDHRRLQGNLYVDKAVHEAFVAVNEKGTEAAAVTSMAMSEESLTIRPQAKVFIADHPFIFIIQENGTDKILFMGRVVEPA